MIYYIAYSIYFGALLCASLLSLYRFRKMDVASKILSLLICCALIVEGAAYYLAKVYHNNLWLYAVFGIVEFGMLCLYFNKVIDVFVKWNIGIYIGITGITLGILNLIFLQGINSLNSYFLLFEGLSVIGMSLFAFFRLLLKEDTLSLHKYPHFWFISILLFFWCITFLNWGLYDYININLQYAAWKINTALQIVTAITYGCFICVYLLYPKMQQL